MIIDFSKMDLHEQRLLKPEQLPEEVLNTWNDWLNNFDASTTENKLASKSLLQVHFDACQKFAIDPAAVASIMKLGEKKK